MPAADGGEYFVDLQSGMQHRTAYVVYTGVNLTAKEVVAKASAIISNPADSLCLAESFLAELTRFKVGNVVAVDSNDGRVVRLRLVSLRPKRDF